MQPRRTHQRLKKALHLVKCVLSCVICFLSKTGSTKKPDSEVKGGLELSVYSPCVVRARIMLKLNALYTLLLRIGLRHARTNYSPLKLSSLLSSALVISCCRGDVEEFLKVLPLSVKKLSSSHLHPSLIVSVPSLCRCLGNMLHSQHIHCWQSWLAGACCWALGWTDEKDPWRRPHFLLRLVTNFCRIDGCQEGCPVFWQCKDGMLTLCCCIHGFCKAPAFSILAYL